MRTTPLRPVGWPARTPAYGVMGKQCTHGSWISSTNVEHWHEHAPHTLVDGESASKGDVDSSADGVILHFLMSTVRDTMLEDTAEAPQVAPVEEDSPAQCSGPRGGFGSFLLPPRRTGMSARETGGSTT